MNNYLELFDMAPMAIWEEDVSALKAELDRLRSSGVSNFREYFDAHPDFVAEAARMIVVTNVNQSAVSLWGANSKDELLRSGIKILTPASESAFREELVAIGEGRDVFKTEASILSLDGRSLDVLVEMRIPSDTDRFNHLLLTIVDITDRVRSEKALKESEELFRTVFFAAKDCIYLKDKDLKFTRVNPATASLLQRPISEIIGKDAGEIFGEEAGAHIREVELRVMSGESVEEEHTRPVNGIPMTFHDVRAPLRDSEGSIVGVLGISRNVTERKRHGSVRVPAASHYPSQAIKNALAQGRRAAATDSTVLLLGESGSGKDYISRWIHDNSRRSAGPFFSINCATIPGDLAESELFGHEVGAYTGARTRKRGLLELAEGGTLLLNEIGELTLPMQAKLLSFLDTKSFLRVGGEKSISVNARIIAATHRDLEHEVSVDQFLRPLWYRLNVFTIKIPPLRERLEDLPALVKEILGLLRKEIPTAEDVEVNRETLEKLQAYHWPGNVRELRNVLERALMISEGRDLEVSLPQLMPAQGDWSCTVSTKDGWDLERATDFVARSMCVEALRRCGGSRTLASRELGMSRTSLYRLMKRFGLLREIETRS